MKHCATCRQPIRDGEDSLSFECDPDTGEFMVTIHNETRDCVAAAVRRCAEKVRYLTAAVAEEHRFLGNDIIWLIEDEFGSTEEPKG